MNLSLRPPRLPHATATGSSVRRCALIAGLWLALGGSVPHVAAQPQGNPPPAGASDRDQEARQRFQRGREAYEDGRYRDAWAEFHEAYRLSGRPELLFNVGQTADRLGREADAIKAFEMYLQRLPNAANRRDVENRLRALRERIEAAPAPPPAATDKTPAAQQPATAPGTPTPALPPGTAAAPPVATQPLSPRERRRVERAERARAERERAERERAERAKQAEREAKPEPDTSDRRRGLYLRVAGGLGIRADAVDNEVIESSIFGYGLALDLAAGWAVLPGFVIGGGVFLDWSTRPTLSSGDAELTLDHAYLTTIGPFVDFYPLRRTLGLHIEGGIGFGIMSIQYTGESAFVGGQTVRERLRTSPTGVSFFLGVGYEWTVVSAFAMGVLLRLTAAALTDDPASHGVFSPSLLMSLTWL